MSPRSSGRCRLSPGASRIPLYCSKSPGTVSCAAPGAAVQSGAAGTSRQKPMERTALYERVATRITQLIHRGTFRPGERIPSVRDLSRQLEVSITTVMEAYRLLEDHGLVE